MSVFDLSDLSEFLYVEIASRYTRAEGPQSFGFTQGGYFAAKRKQGRNDASRAGKQ
jgi:hypothetical protein